VQWARREYDTFHGNPVDAYTRELRSRLALAYLLGDAVMAEPVRGCVATFFRTASGPGWALVGDVGPHQDPLIARGIADTFPRRGPRGIGRFRRLA